MVGEKLKSGRGGVLTEADKLNRRLEIRVQGLKGKNNPKYLVNIMFLKGISLFEFLLCDILHFLQLLLPC